MYTIKPLPEFTIWLDGLKDCETRVRLSRRLDKVQRGQVGNGVFELREHLGRRLAHVLHTARFGDDCDVGRRR